MKAKYKTISVNLKDYKYDVDKMVADFDKKVNDLLAEGWWFPLGSIQTVNRTSCVDNGTIYLFQTMMIKGTN